MKSASQMTNAEKAAFRRHPAVRAEYQQFFEYFALLREEIDSKYNGAATTEDYYCALRSALGFDHPSMRDPRAPSLKLIRPYLLEEIDIVCKKPRAILVDGHIIVPQIIPNLNNSTMKGGLKRTQKKNARTRRNKRR